MDVKAATEHRELQASLRRRNGPLSETSYRLRGEVFRVGRDPENNLVIEGPEAAIVSSRHLEIRRSENTFRLVDLDSTNGTYLDGQRIAEGDPSQSLFDHDGPRRAGVRVRARRGRRDRFEPNTPFACHTFAVPAQAPGQVSIVLPAPSTGRQDELLKEAVKRARQARRSGIGGQTSIIMRDMLDKALHRSSRKFKITIGVLVVALLGVSSLRGLDHSESEKAEELRLMSRSIRSKQSSSPRETIQNGWTSFWRS